MKTATKAGLLWLAVPWTVFVLAALAWSIYWFGLAGAARERVQDWAAAQNAAGAQARIGRIVTRGFPVLLRLELSDLAYAPAEAGWRASTAAGALHVQMFNPQHAIFEARAPIALARANGDVTNISADALIVSVRTAGGALAQAGVEADNLALDDPAEDGVLGVQKLVLNVRADPRNGDDAQIALRAMGLALPRPVRSFEALGQDVHTLQAAIVAERAGLLLRGAEDDPLGPWRAAGGRLRLEALTLRWGALQSAGAGHVGLDEQRRLTGMLALPIEQPAPLLRALASGPDVGEDAARALMLLSAAFAGADQGLTLDVEAQGGVLRLEGVRVRTLPPVY